MSDVVEGTETVTIAISDLRMLLLSSGARKYFDEDYYLACNEDVKLAVAAGLTNGFDHFLHFGFLEGRAPFNATVDEKYYLESYPDVADAVEKGHCKSAQWHYDTCGKREGRIPQRPAPKDQDIAPTTPSRRFYLVRSRAKSC